jgi:phage anti-repressor protein
MHEMSGQQVQAVNLRELHESLDVGRHFPSWVTGRIAEYRFVEGKDYVKVVCPNRGGPARIEYYATLTMGKELAMVENNDRGRN